MPVIAGAAGDNLAHWINDVDVESRGEHLDLQSLPAVECDRVGYGIVFGNHAIDARVQLKRFGRDDLLLGEDIFGCDLRGQHEQQGAQIDQRPLFPIDTTISFLHFQLRSALEWQARLSSVVPKPDFFLPGL